MNLCPVMFEDVSTMDAAYCKAITTMRRFTETGHSILLSAISDELPKGKEHGGTVLDLVVNPHRWCQTNYLYSCVLRLDGRGPALQEALASIEMLLYRLVSEIILGRKSIASCEACPAYSSVILRPAWTYTR